MNAWLDKAQAGIKTARKNISNFRYVDDTTFRAESEEELKSLLMKLKEESEKVGLKLNVDKAKLMEYSSTTSWKIDGKTMETVTDFILGAPKSLQMVTAAIKLRHLLLWRKAMTNLDSILNTETLLYQQRPV